MSGPDPDRVRTEPQHARERDIEVDSREHL